MSREKTPGQLNAVRCRVVNGVVSEKVARAPGAEFREVVVVAVVVVVVVVIFLVVIFVVVVIVSVILLVMVVVITIASLFNNCSSKSVESGIDSGLLYLRQRLFSPPKEPFNFVFHRVFPSLHF